MGCRRAARRICGRSGFRPRQGAAGFRVPTSDAPSAGSSAPPARDGFERAPWCGMEASSALGWKPPPGTGRVRVSPWCGIKAPQYGVEAASHRHELEVASHRTGWQPSPPHGPEAASSRTGGGRVPPTRAGVASPPRFGSTVPCRSWPEGPHARPGSRPPYTQNRTPPSPRTPRKPRPLYGLTTAPPHRQDAAPPTLAGSPTPARPGTPIPLTGWKWGKPGRGGSGGPTLDLCRALRVGCLLWTTTRSSGS